MLQLYKNIKTRRTELRLTQVEYMSTVFHKNVELFSIL